MKKEPKDSEYLDKLRKLVAFHQNKYHTEDNPEISDQAYDALLRELVDLEQKIEGKVSVISSAVGSSPSVAFAKVKHRVPQWSFDNVFDYLELQAWEQKLKRQLAREGFVDIALNYVAEHKIDGLKLVMEYRDGILFRALTRGDGEIGEDVTHSAKTIKSLPQKLQSKVNLICVGEVWMGKTEFEKLNEIQKQNGDEAFANPRNAAAGSLRQLDPEVTKMRNLSLFVYDIDVFEAQQALLAVPTSQFEELNLLKKLGLPINPHSQKCRSLGELENYYQKWKNKYEELPYGVDGVVIKTDDIKVQKAAGYTAKSPRFGIAYKFPAVETTTVIEAIDLQVGRTGVVTPVAHLRAVVVDGSTVTRATLHNEDQIKRLDIRVGDTIVLRKAGDVIPEVVSVIKELRPTKSKAYIFPETVAACGGDGKIERIPGTAAYRCVHLDSEFLNRQKMYYFVSKNALNMDGIGPKIIDALLDKELISDVADLFTLKSEELLVLPGFKQKAADNVIEAIEKARKVSLTRLIVGLSIDNVGEETARLLAGNLSKINDLRQVKLEDLVNIAGVGEVVADNIRTWQNDKKAQALLDKLLLQLDINNDVVKSEGILSGQTFVFTGTMKALTRSQAGEVVRKAGATVTNTVSKKTSYVVVGEEAGSKAKEAVRIGVKILNEEQFLNLIA